MSFVLLVAAFTGGLMAIAYPYWARARAWRLDREYSASGSYIMSLAFASVAGSLILTFVNHPAWYAAVMVGVGSLIMVVLSTVLKSTTQTVSIAIILVSWILYLLVVSI